jgi:type II secretory pathway component PulF
MSGDRTTFSGAPVTERPAVAAPPDPMTGREPPAPAPTSGRSRRPGTRGVKDLAMWSRQLLVLLRSGMPLADAAGAIERQTPEGPWKQVLADVNRRVEEGMPLSAAMSEHPERFDAVSRGLVAAGESSGALDAMLDRLAQLTRQQLRLRRSLSGALVYPSLLVFVAVAVVVVMLFFVLPRFEGLFESLDAPLPPSTSLLLAASGLLRGNWWILIVVPLVGAGAAWLVTGTAGGRRSLDASTLRVPYFGPLRRSLETAKIARLLGVLLESRVPVLEALQLTAQATVSILYGELLVETEEAVGRGESISQAFGRSELVAASIAEAVHHGEHGGQTGSVLTTLADFMDEDNEAAVKAVTSMLEPIIMIVLGVIVGFIAISLFLPLFDLTAATGTGGS